jgi:hypothetical protein
MKMEHIVGNLYVVLVKRHNKADNHMQLGLLHIELELVKTKMVD